MNDTGTGKLLMNGDCPYNYQCKAVDCMECVEIHNEKKDVTDINVGNK